MEQPLLSIGWWFFTGILYSGPRRQLLQAGKTAMVPITVPPAAAVRIYGHTDAEKHAGKQATHRQHSFSFLELSYPAVSIVSREFCFHLASNELPLWATVFAAILCTVKRSFCRALCADACSCLVFACFAIRRLLQLLTWILRRRDVVVDENPVSFLLLACATRQLGILGCGDFQGASMRALTAQRTPTVLQLWWLFDAVPLFPAAIAENEKKLAPFLSPEIGKRTTRKNCLFVQEVLCG